MKGKLLVVAPEAFPKFRTYFGEFFDRAQAVPVLAFATWGSFFRLKHVGIDNFDILV